jgi:hypothetical protein
MRRVTLVCAPIIRALSIVVSMPALAAIVWPAGNSLLGSSRAPIARAAARKGRQTSGRPNGMFFGVRAVGRLVTTSRPASPRHSRLRFLPTAGSGP